MSTFVFVGDFADIQNPNYNFRRFGQREDMDEQFAQSMVKRNVPLIPATVFDALQISPEDLKAYPNAVSHARAPEDFLKKKQAALEALSQYRESLLAQ